MQWVRRIVKAIFFSIFRLEYGDGKIKVFFRDAHIFNLNLCERWVKKYKEQLQGGNNIYILNSNIGECYVVLKYFSGAIVRNHSDAIFIFTRKMHLEIAQMFNFKYKYAFIDNRMVDYFPGKFNVGHVNFTVLFNHEYYTSFEKSLRIGGVDYFSNMENFLNIKSEVEGAIKITISDDIKRSVRKKIERLNLIAGEFVFICPEANTCEDMSNEELNLIVNRCRQKGLDCFVNINSRESYYSIEGIKSTSLTLQECFEMARVSYCIVGVKSGLMEMLSETGVRCIVIAKKFKNRPENDPISAKQGLSAFSATHLPIKFKVEEYTNLNRVLI